MRRTWINQETVFSILDSCGITDHLSDSAYSAIFLVVDHAELAAQKYFPLIEEAAEERKDERKRCGHSAGQDIDERGKRRIYGTQNIAVGNGDQTTAYVCPVEDPENLDPAALLSRIGGASRIGFLNSRPRQVWILSMIKIDSQENTETSETESYGYGREIAAFF